MPSTSPAATDSVTSSRARKVAASPGWRCGFGKATVSRSTSSSGAASAMVDAAHIVPFADPLQSRAGGAAVVVDQRTARREGAALPLADRRRDLARDFAEPRHPPLELRRGVD